MSNIKDLLGLKFGRLVVKEFSGLDKRKKSLWLCECDCGNTTIVRASDLSNNKTRSCGCYQKESRYSHTLRHGNTCGRSSTITYASWQSMIKRCYNKKGKCYKNYGGRGITVCDRWTEEKTGFVNFLLDMGECPKGLTLDRIENNGNYEPGNCRWATYIEQANNTRNNRFLEYNGKKLTIAQWSRETGINRYALRDRLKRGWSIEDSLTRPIRSSAAQ